MNFINLFTNYHPFYFIGGKQLELEAERYSRELHTVTQWEKFSWNKGEADLDHVHEISDFKMVCTPPHAINLAIFSTLYSKSKKK